MPFTWQCPGLQTQCPDLRQKGQALWAERLATGVAVDLRAIKEVAGVRGIADAPGRWIGALECWK